MLLGATAVGALAGPGVSVMRARGKPLDLPLAPLVIPTVHPSSILRAGPGREDAFAAFVQDLRVVAAWLAKHAA